MYCPGHDRVMGNDKVDWRGLHWMYCSGHVRVVGNDRAGKTGEDYFGCTAMGTSESWEMSKQIRQSSSATITGGLRLRRFS